MKSRIADEDDAVMQQFFGGGGGQQRMDPMTLAMQILEMGRKGREFQTTSGLSREDQEATNKYRQDVLAQQGVKQASDIDLADMQKRALLDEIAGRAAETKAKRAFEVEQLKGERRKGEMGMVTELLKGQNLTDKATWDKAMEMVAGYSEPVKQTILGNREQALKTVATAALPGLQAGYTKGDPKLIAAAIQGLPQEVLQRPEIDWQKLSAGWGGEQGANVSGTAQGAGLAGRLWNLPGAAQNVGKGIVGGLLNLVMGEENAPKIAPTAYTNPLKEVPRMMAAGPSVGPAPEGPVGGYTTGPAEPPVEWRYGVGTQPVPSPLQRLFAPR